MVVGSAVVVEANVVVISTDEVTDDTSVASSVLVGSAIEVGTYVVESELDSISEVAVDEPVSTESVVKDPVSVVVETIEGPDEERLHGEAEASWHEAKS
ncbi:hypothetical protein FPOAC2_05364 [Fusarium poae]|jgi:hypothetical protein